MRIKTSTEPSKKYKANDEVSPLLDYFPGAENSNHYSPQT